MIVQGRSMTALQSDDILTNFLDKKKRTVVLCVQGGSFAEGIDLPNGAISGAIIVGPAVPKCDLERKTLQDYYEKQFRRGSDFAFTYPAMTKVVQAAGRVIRSEKDVGLIVLMDKRFVANNYAQAMPSDWFDASPRELVASQIDKEVTSFWARAAVNQSI
jgi:DNA excision repair protein ERCC-2